MVGAFSRMIYTITYRTEYGKIRKSEVEAENHIRALDFWQEHHPDDTWIRLKGIKYKGENDK